MMNLETYTVTTELRRHLKYRRDILKISDIRGESTGVTA